MLLVALVAHADPIVSVGDPHTYSLGGGWARAYPADEGWHFLWSAGGDYNRLPMTEDYEIDDRDRQKLTGYTTLADHGITRCPDGSFLHGASANIEKANDSAYAFRFDQDFDLIGGGAVEERNSERQHNDLAVSCGEIFSGVGFNESGMNGDAIVFPVDDDGEVGESQELQDAPFMQGASFAHDDDTLILLSVKNNRYLHLVRYDQDLEPIDIQELDPLGGSMRVYWPQGLMRVGDLWIVAHMARNDSQGWHADEGDVWLEVYTADWELVQTQQVTEFDAPTGCMRPGLARKNETLLVTWDSNVSPGITPVELDLAEFGVEEGEDTGQWQDPEDDGEGGEDEDGGPSFEPWEEDEEGCGCSAAPGWSLGGLLLVPWWRRRC